MNHAGSTERIWNGKRIQKGWTEEQIKDSRRSSRYMFPGWGDMKKNDSVEI